jgi:MinD-like ATPase involved in chromosome partitioning or flagellar assembly
MLRSGLPGAIAWCLAAMTAGGGAVLAWGRMSGRPLVEWAVLLARFVVRTRRTRAATLRAGLRRRAVAAPAALLSSMRRRLRRRGSPAASALVIPLALRSLGQDGRARSVAGPRAFGTRGHVVAFFSLNGGSGRTTLAVEAAAVLAVRSRTLGTRGLRVALLDLTMRSPAVALRLGLTPPPGGRRDGQPSEPAGRLVTHDTGLLVFAEASPAPLCGAAAAASARTLIDIVSADGVDVIVVDIDCTLDELCVDVLQRCDLVLVTMTPTAGGVLDAYRSTAALRRLGLRDRLGYVVNRCHGDVDLDETLADLGGTIVAQLPDDVAFVDAENNHHIAGLRGGSAVAVAVADLAMHIEDMATGRTAPLELPTWGSHAG